MLNRFALAVATAGLLATGPALAQTQGDGAGSQPGQMMQQGDAPGMSMMQGRGMMGGHGMMGGQGMMCGQGAMGGQGGMCGQGAMQGRGAMGGGSGPGGMGGHMMLMMMALTDTDASETLSLEEVQAVHARMFKYADENDDGQLSMQELHSFMHGKSGPSEQ